MADWKKLIAYLDEQDENRVRLTVSEISEIVGELRADSAWSGPTQGGRRVHGRALGGLTDYWRSAHVLPILEEAGWTVDFTDYVKQVVGFCLQSQTDEKETRSSLAAAIQALVLQARRVGKVTSITTTKTLEDGTSITLTVDPSDQAAVGKAEHQSRGDAPQERPESHQVSPEYPIKRLPSTEAPTESIRFDDNRSVRWPVDISENDHRGFRRAVRRRVTDIEEGQGLGGYGCLATMSRKKSAQTGTPAIYSPAALGLRRVQEEGTLFGLVVQQKVAILSIIGRGFDKPDSIRVEVKNKTAQSVRFVVPRHTVFEQEAHVPRAQDILLRDPVDGVLSPNETKSFAVWGLCMDEERARPSGEALLLTPWTLSTSVDEQDELWNITEGKDSDKEANRGARSSRSAGRQARTAAKPPKGGARPRAKD